MYYKIYEPKMFCISIMTFYKNVIYIPLFKKSNKSSFAYTANI